MVGFRLQEAVADVPVEAPPSQDEAEIRSLMFDMKVSLSHGKKYEPPPRSDMPPLPMHQYEYEVRVVFFCVVACFFFCRFFMLFVVFVFRPTVSHAAVRVVFFAFLLFRVFCVFCSHVSCCVGWLVLVI